MKNERLARLAFGSSPGGAWFIRKIALCESIAEPNDALSRLPLFPTTAHDVKL